MPPKSGKKAKAQRETNRGWAEGAREDLLNEHVDDFAAAMSKGAAAEEEVLRRVIRQYFYHFDLDDTIEPSLPLKPFDEAWTPPLEDGTLEELRAKRDLREKKKKSIRAWLLYRSLKLSSIRSTVRRRLLSDGYLALLNKVGKLGFRPPKARSASQEWQKQNKEEASRIVQDLWDIEVNAGRQTIPARGGISAKFRQETIQAHFQSFAPDVQKAWAGKAKAVADGAKAEWDKVYNGPPSTAPEDRAACVRNLPTFLQPVAEGIMSLTGLMTIVHVVGPMGAMDGEIGVMSVCAGKNLDTVPVTVSKWDPATYEAWRNHLVKFAQTAYSENDKAGFKMSSNPVLPADFKATVLDDDTLDAVTSSVNAEVAAKDTGGLASTDDEGSDGDDTDDEGAASRKRPAAGTGSSSSKRQKTTDGEGYKQQPRSVDPNLVMVDGRWMSQYEVQRAENMRKNKAILDSLQINTAALPKATGKGKTRNPASVEKTAVQPAGAPVRRQSGRRSGRELQGPAIAPAGVNEMSDIDEGHGGDVPMDVDQPSMDIVDTMAPTPAASIVKGVPIVTPAASDTMVARASPSVEENPPIVTPPPSAVAPSASAGSVVAIPVSLPPMQALPVGAPPSSAIVAPTSVSSSGTKLDDEAREILLEQVPVWFSVPFQVFCAKDWGDSWKELLEAFVKLEGSVDFAITEGYLPRTGRPAILSDWVADGRLKPKKGAGPKKMLLLQSKEVPKFEASFVAWWDSMQPPWRKESEKGTWLRKGRSRDYGELDVWGQNGWLSVVACLYWWREAQKDDVQFNVWEEYVTDATWLMQGLRERGYKEEGR